MKKITQIVAVVLACFAIHTAKAQVEYNHGLGATTLIATHAAGWGITYDSRLNLLNVGDNANLSLGTHLTLGLSLNSQNPEGNSLVFDFPILAEYNFGYGSSKDNDEGFGFFGGLGYNLSSVQAGAESSNSSSGIMLDGGVRFNVKVPVSVRVSYLISNASNNPESTNVFGLGVSYIFGMNN